MSFNELSRNIILRSSCRCYPLTTIKVKVNHNMKLRPFKLLVQFLAICSLQIQLNHATAGITEQMPLADKLAQQPAMKRAIIGMMDFDTYGKCANTFTMYLVASAKGAKFDDNMSFSIAALGSVLGVARRNFLANGYTDGYLVEVVKFHGNSFNEDRALECMSVLMKAVEEANKAPKLK